MNGSVGYCRKNKGEYWHRVSEVLGNIPVEYSEYNTRYSSSVYIISEAMLTDADCKSICLIVGSSEGKRWTFKRDEKLMFGVRFEGANFDKRFNRKKFDPVKDWDDATILNILRSPGKRRFYIWRDWNEGSSTSFEYLQLEKTQGGLFLDLGCGDSPDCLIAESLGYQSIGFDLFPRSKELSIYPAGYQVRADIAEGLPLRDCSVDAAVCQAVIDLIEPQARSQFYREVRRVMKVGGLFSIRFMRLKHGWGYNQPSESKLIEEAGFVRVRSYGTGYVFKAV
jgi:SAM-dependent methyltransferase